MELQVTQENFSKALSNASRIANNKTPLPILNNILLRTDGSRLLVAATNLEVASSTHIGAKVKKQGEITIPARLVTEFVNSLPKDIITLSVERDQLTISSNHYNSKINGMNTEEFPELPTQNSDQTSPLTIQGMELKEALTQTIITSSGDATRPVLTGVYWHTFEGSLFLAATDGYRLSERKLTKTDTTIDAIIPTSTLQEVLRLLTDDLDTVDISITDTEVYFQIEDTSITSRLIDGSFPDYRQLIPKTSEVVAVIEKQEFVRITKIASLFARESGGGIVVDIDKDDSSLSIHSIASEIGENTSKTDVKDITESGKITLNSRYLNEALSVTKSDSIKIGFSGSLSPFVITGTDKKTQNYMHIVMPLKS